MKSTSHSTHNIESERVSGCLSANAGTPCSEIFFPFSVGRLDRMSHLLTRFRCTLSFTILLLFLLLPSQALAASRGGPWIFSTGYTYYSGFEDIRSTYKKNAVASDACHDVVQWSFGFTLQAHRRISESLRIGAGIGPVMTLLKDADHIQVPASVSVIAILFPDWTHSPFVRAGGSYHITKGDYLGHSRPGLLAGAGVAFFAQKSLNLTLEAAYDGAYVTIERPEKFTPRKIRAGALVLSISAVF